MTPTFRRRMTLAVLVLVVLIAAVASVVSH